MRLPLFPGWLLLSIAGASAQAAPAFKQAPGSDSGGGNGDGSSGFSLDLGLEQHEWLQPVLQFLGDYYGYMGVVFVLLVLFLFARGKGGDEEAPPAGGGDEDFFEPGDAKRFGDRR